eukprot:4805290-Pleurochrysis_carterae.AAC.2
MLGGAACRRTMRGHGKWTDMVTGLLKVQIAAALDGVDSIVCAVGFAGGNPFEMGKLAHAVDNVGTCKLIEAASAAKISNTRALVDGSCSRFDPSTAGSSSLSALLHSELDPHQRPRVGPGAPESTRYVEITV